MSAITRSELIDAFTKAKEAAQEFASQPNISSIERSNRQVDVNTLVLMIEENIDALAGD